MTRVLALGVRGCANARHDEPELLASALLFPPHWDWRANPMAIVGIVPCVLVSGFW